MARIVKVAGSTRVSSKNQITIPVAKLLQAGIETGDRVFVRSEGPGRLTIEKVDEVMSEYSGVLTGKIQLPTDLDAEWD